MRYIVYNSLQTCAAAAAPHDWTTKKKRIGTRRRADDNSPGSLTPRTLFRALTALRPALLSAYCPFQTVSDRLRLDLPKYSLKLDRSIDLSALEIDAIREYSQAPSKLCVIHFILLLLVVSRSSELGKRLPDVIHQNLSSSATMRTRLVPRWQGLPVKR